MSGGNDSAIPAHIQQATIDTFSVQAQIMLSLESATTEASDAPRDATSYDCMSVLGLKSEAYTGALALGFPKVTFLAILERMLGEKFEQITTQNADACSELLNIIYASARVKINASGFDFQPAIPATILGTNLMMALGNSSKILKFSFQSEVGPFAVALSLKKAKK